jgi:hypothetical protein
MKIVVPHFAPTPRLNRLIVSVLWPVSGNKSPELSRSRAKEYPLAAPQAQTPATQKRRLKKDR